MVERGLGGPNDISLHPYVTVYGQERSRTAAPLMLHRDFTEGSHVFAFQLQQLTVFVIAL